MNFEWATDAIVTVDARFNVIQFNRATLENGCLQMIPGSHLWGPTPHVHESLANCHIRAEDLRLDTAIPLPMNAGDTVIFNGLLHHFSAFNRSNHRRRALQFHFAQDGAVWGTEEHHRRLFHDNNGHYAGCVKGNDARVMDILTGKRQRAVPPATRTGQSNCDSLATDARKQ